MNQFEPKSALHEKLCFFKRINLALVLCGAMWQKLVKNWILEPFVLKFRQILKYFQVWFEAQFYKCPDSSVGRVLDIFHLILARPDQTREGAGSIPP
jgi:hypothetical protein